MTGWSLIWLIVRIVFSLLPQIIQEIRDEEKKQTGRDQIVQAVLKRFEDVKERLNKSRDAARDAYDNGVRNDEFKRD